VTGTGSASRPFVATSGDELIPHPSSSAVVSSLPVPQGPYRRMLLLTDDRAAPATSIVNATRRLSLTAAGAQPPALPAPSASSAVTAASRKGDDTALEADSADNEEAATALLGLSDADIENARYRHRLAGMVASPAAAVAIGLLPPRLSYASLMRNRPLLGPATSPTHSSAGASSAFGALSANAASAPSTSIVPQYQHLRPGAAHPVGTSSLRRLQQEGPLSLLTDGDASSGPSSASGGGGPTDAPSGGPSGSSGPTAGDRDSGDGGSDGSSTGRSVVFGRHAVSFGSWPPFGTATTTAGSTRPLLTNTPHPRPPTAPQSTDEAGHESAANTTRLLRLRARATNAGAGAGVGAGVAEDANAIASTPLILPNFPLDEMTAEEVADLLAFSLQAQEGSVAAGKPSSSSAAAGGGGEKRDI
jgi:hypothetical protein